MKKTTPNIPYNFPITMDFKEDAWGRFKKENRDTFFTFLKSGDLADINYQSYIGVEKAKSYITWINEREQRSIELQNKEWDSDDIRENGFNTFFPSDEYLKDSVFKGNPYFTGVRDYQILDAYMLSRSTNMLITHQMRLGKTAIATLGMLNNDKINNAVIIVPKSTIYEWKETINTWTDGKLKADIMSADNKPKENEEIFAKFDKGDIDVVIINLDHFIKYKDLFALKEEDIDLLVIDEAHFLTNRNKNEMQLLSGKKAQQLLMYRKQNVKFCWLITGTPTKKEEHEILSLYYFISPPNRDQNVSFRNFKLDNYKWYFNRFYSLDSIPSPMNRYAFETSMKKGADKVLRELSLNHRIHRNTRDEFKDKSEMVLEDIHLQLNDHQIKAYKSTNQLLKNAFVEITNPLHRDTFLRKIAVDHRLMVKNIKDGLKKLVDKENDNYDEVYVKQLFKDMLKSKFNGSIEDSVKMIEEIIDNKYKTKGSKVEWFLQYLKEQKEYIQGNMLSDVENGKKAKEYININNIEDKEEITNIKKDFAKKGRNPIVVFSQFKSFLYLLKEDIESVKSLGFKVEMISGDVKGDKREEIRQSFQNGEIDLLLVQIDTVKEGVSLFRSNQAIFFDRKFSNQVMKQVIERINHPSSEDVKSVYFLMSKDTIDDHVKDINETAEMNTVYQNEHIMADISGSGKKNALDLFNNYLKNK